MSGPTIEKLRVALVAAPLDTPIVAPFGTVTTRHNLLVRVETSDGCWGIGEAWGNFPPWGCRERVDILTNVVRPALIGQALDDPARLYRGLAQTMRALANQLGAPGPFQQALCGADIALWDAMARRAGCPLADFIRGRPSSRRVDVYATNLPIQRLAAVEEMASKGHTRFKFRVAGNDTLFLDRLREARSVVGARPMMADATQSLQLETLRPLVGALDELALEWLEEPFLVDDEKSYVAWCAQNVRPPIALGENSYRLAGFRRLLDVIRPEVVQPDITKTGGISEGQEICRDILAAGRRACLHMYGGPVGLYASANLSAAIDGMSWLEMDSLPNPLFDMLLRHPPTVEDGKLHLGAEPGLGELIREDVFERFEVI
ncbi:mandelate racemase/muconate lactonizing enzyme family protein [Bradyrhizobium mercantei]|uniref:mandelate racemase/muconate lactonizing enzyme family protein n=1 Tax=Bradyrhizobium mercantei TaxID=1904807 RepID=UPI00097664A4|nr:mandelate racemase/muconate lactonizing enzyme family protein [Bradyrhizobium mercantei]